MCVHNLAPDVRDATLRIGGGTLVDLRHPEELASDDSGAHHVPLEPYGYRWFRHGELTQALARRPFG